MSAEIIGPFFGKEREPYLLHTIVKACMDENIILDKGLVLAGVGGCGVVNKDHDSRLFPRKKMDLIEEMQHPLNLGLKQIAQAMDMENVVVLSHSTCGWAMNQGIKEEDLMQMTSVQAQEAEFYYGGHILPGKVPVQIDSEYPDIQACLRREKEDPHSAIGVLITVGGGVSQPVKDGIMERKRGKLFTIAADPLAIVSDYGISFDDAVEFLKHELIVAQAIMQDKALEFFLYDAGRLDKNIRSANINIAELALKKLP